MKGALGLIVAILTSAGVVWIFWMTWEWLRNKKKETKKSEE